MMHHAAGLLSLYLLTAVAQKPARPPELPKEAPRPSEQVMPTESPLELLPVAPGQTVRARRGIESKAASGSPPKALPADDPAWLRQYGTAADDIGTGIAASCEGVYSVGYSGAAFDGNSPLGGVDALLIKHSLSGTKQWSRQFGTADNDYAVGVASFDLGGQCANPVLYVAGYTVTPKNGADVFLAKYDKAGTLVWMRQFGTEASDIATSVATDSAGNVYVAGYTTGSLATTSAGGQDLFVVKYDSAGVQVWKRQLGSNKNDQARGVACDVSGNVYVGGHTFGGLDGNSNVSGTAATSDIFLTKYDSTGLKLWTKQLGTTKSEVVQGLATSRRVNGIVDVYLVGHTVGAFAVPSKTSGDYDGVLVKFNDAGAVQWKRQFGTPGNDLLFGVTSDGGGNVYVTGSSPNDINPPNAALDGDDVFMMSFKENGDLFVTRQIGSTNPADPNAQVDAGAGIATDRGAGVYVVGYTEGQFSNTAKAGGRDLLVFRYSEGCDVITPTRCTQGYGWGDPHYVTLDGIAYDFQGYGEFILTESIAGDIVVQARERPWNGSPYVCVFSAFATRLGTDRVTFDIGANPPVRINGTSVAVSGELSLSGGGRILRQGSDYTLVWPTGDHLVLSAPGNYINAYLRLSPSRAGKMRGPLGNFNGDRSDDFALRNGTALPSSLSFTQMYVGESAYVNSWRISQAESLFDYGPNESTATFTNVNFPYQPPPTPAPAQQQQAQQACQNAGVTNTALLDGCITDVVTTGESAFATAAAATQASAQAQGSPPPAAPAPRTVYLNNFEDGTTPGWTSQVTSASPTGERTFLGEFGNESVQFSLASLPSHKKITVSFDLYVLNGWSGNTGPNRFSVKLNNGALLLDTTFSNNSRYLQSYPGNYLTSSKAGSGAAELNTLHYPSGDSVYRFKYTLDHTDASLSLLFGVQGLSGATGEAWGLDNVEIQLQ